MKLDLQNARINLSAAVGRYILLGKEVQRLRLYTGVHSYPAKLRASFLSQVVNLEAWAMIDGKMGERKVVRPLPYLPRPVRSMATITDTQ